MIDQGKRELIQYRLNRAKDTLNEVNLLVENKLWNTAVNRLYYACYYAVIAPACQLIDEIDKLITASLST